MTTLHKHGQLNVLNATSQRMFHYVWQYFVIFIFTRQKQQSDKFSTIARVLLFLFQNETYKSNFTCCRVSMPDFNNNDNQVGSKLSRLSFAKVLKAVHYFICHLTVNTTRCQNIFPFMYSDSQCAVNVRWYVLFSHICIIFLTMASTNNGYSICMHVPRSTYLTVVLGCKVYLSNFHRKPCKKLIR